MSEVGITITKAQATRIVKTLWDIVKTYNDFVMMLRSTGDPRSEEYYEITPEDLLSKEFPDEERWKIIRKYLEIKAGMGRNVNSIIANLQAIQLRTKVFLLPPGYKQREYTGKYSGAYLPREVIDSVLLDILKLYKETHNKFYIKAIKGILFLLETASRREALTNFKVLQRDFKVRNRIIIDLYGEDTFVVVQTEEKGKRGEKITWYKFIRKSLEDVAIPDTLFSPKEVVKLSNIFKKIVLKYADKLNDVTKLYLVEAKRSLHVIRHTSAYNFLIASNYNMFLCSKLLGWKKADNLKIYANPTLLEIAQIDRAEVEK
jgi:hypothetical protein